MKKNQHLQQAQYDELNSFVKEFNVENIPDFKEMTREDIRSFFKNVFTTALQDYESPDFVEKAFCLKAFLFPSRLYQYRKFDDAGLSLKALQENYIWLSEPSKFNDPFDCAGCFDINESLSEMFLSKDLFLNNKKIKEAKQNLKIGMNFFDATLKNNKLLLEEDKEKFLETHNKLLSVKMDEMKSKLQQQVKISCFSETNVNILMWSHYAQNHTGFCIEYDISTIAVLNDFKMQLYPAVYTLNPISITKAIFSKRMDVIKHLLFINKSIDWAYENEWRYIGCGDIQNMYNMPVKPTAVYLGTKISQKNENKITDIANANGINIRKMVLKQSSFEMEVINNK